ncbi:hypothetical protein D3C78_1368340 [compost metagenome]
MLLPIVPRQVTIGVSPSGCITAEAKLKINARTNILIAGKAHKNNKITTPTKPIEFLTRSDAEITVSVASANTFPTTGTKFPVKYLAALNVTPSVTEPAIPFTEMTPRNIVRRIPSSAMLTVRIKFAICVNLYLSVNELTICMTAEKNSNGNTTV